MHHSLKTSAFVLAASLLLAGCAEGGRTDYEVDGDTGAASPNASPVPNTAAAIGPDSTLGVGERTGRGGTAGTRGDTAARPDSGRIPPR